MDFLSQCTSGGCGAKIESRVLNQLLQHLPETPQMSGYSSGLNMPTTPLFTK
ncbi:selenide, water dikinase [Enterococcus sp. DIV1385a]